MTFSTLGFRPFLLWGEKKNESALYILFTSPFTSCNKQQFRVWSQHETGERLLLSSREKAGHGDTSRQSWNRRSQWVKCKLKYKVHIDHMICELG